MRSSPVRQGLVVESLESRRLFAAVNWISTSDGNWSNPDNWSTHTVPGANDDVTINPGGQLFVTVDGTQVAKSVTVPGDDTLTIGTSATLALGGDSTVN